jgi:hypothetical protein
VLDFLDLYGEENLSDMISQRHAETPFKLRLLKSQEYSCDLVCSVRGVKGLLQAIPAIYRRTHPLTGALRVDYEGEQVIIFQSRSFCILFRLRGYIPGLSIPWIRSVVSQVHPLQSRALPTEFIPYEPINR